MTYLILNESSDPFFNMAAEEYVLTQFSRVIMLWRNCNTVVVGKNQNTMAEINLDYAKQHNISIVRRLTGGGTVFHDMGNINYTMIMPWDNESFCDYGWFTRPVCSFLKGIGVEATLSGRNDLLVEGMKISGNAQTVKNKKIMHHGTLLFSSNVSSMEGVLNPCKLKMESKGIASVAGRVTNIASHLQGDGLTPLGFYKKLADYFKTTVKDLVPYTFNKEDVAKIKALAKEKYGTWEWNFGSAPPYTIEKKKKFPFATVTLAFGVENGCFSSFQIYGDFFGIEEVGALSAQLIGERYEEQAIKQRLSTIAVGDYITGMTREAFIGLLC